MLKRLSIQPNDKKADEIFTHSYYQGILVEIGNIKKYSTYIPAQDKNKKFLEMKLGELATFDTIPKFTYDNLTKRAKTIDVIWFNERQMPCKFYELQDFRADFYIIADESRRNQFDEIMAASMYNPIRNYVKFTSYDSIIKQYAKEQIVLDDEL